jgi:Cytochrome c, mono- and diheme variants
MSAKRQHRTGRRHPLVGVALLVLGLFVTGGAYAATSAGIASAQEDNVPSATLIEDGERLFLANCASCHGTNGEGTEAGPSLIGVGALSVEFQVGTGRMPMAASSSCKR